MLALLVDVVLVVRGVRDGKSVFLFVLDLPVGVRLAGDRFLALDAAHLI